MPAICAVGGCGHFYLHASQGGEHWLGCRPECHQGTPVGEGERAE